MRIYQHCLVWGHSWCDLYNQWGNRRGRRCDRCDRMQKVDDKVCVRPPKYNLRNFNEIEGDK